MRKELRNFQLSFFANFEEKWVFHRRDEMEVFYSFFSNSLPLFLGIRAILPSSSYFSRDRSSKKTKFEASAKKRFLEKKKKRIKENLAWHFRYADFFSSVRDARRKCLPSNKRTMTQWCVTPFFDRLVRMRRKRYHRKIGQKWIKPIFSGAAGEKLLARLLKLLTTLFWHLYQNN